MTLLRTLESIDSLDTYLSHGIAVVQLVSWAFETFWLDQKSNWIYEAIFDSSLKSKELALTMEWNMFIALWNLSYFRWF